MSVHELVPEGGWTCAETVRLPPPAPAQRGLLFRTVSQASRFFGRQNIPDVFSVFHINSRLFWAWLFFASRLMPGGRLPAREREKIILRTAWNCRSRYEWGQHVEIALRVGVSDEDIIRVSRGPSAFEDARTRAAMQACDDLFRQQMVSAETWQQLSQFHDRRNLIEMMILIGHYQMLAGFLNSSGIALEAQTESKVEDFHRRTGPSRPR